MLFLCLNISSSSIFLALLFCLPSCADLTPQTEMLQKNLKDLKRSISAKFRKRSKSTSQSIQIPAIISDHQCATSSHDEEDPYREILRTNSDNVSHLVFHGSSLKSMRSFDSDKSVTRPEFHPSCSDTHLDRSNHETNLKPAFTLKT